MKTCATHQILLDKQLDGSITPGELVELEAHAATCSTCRAELAARALVQQVVREALVPRTDAESAKHLVLARIPAGTAPQESPVDAWAAWLGAIVAGKDWMVWARRAVVASIFLAIGCGLGAFFNRPDVVRITHAPPALKVPLEVAHLEGTVLVKHLGAEEWQQVRTNSAIYLGDTFHCAAKAGVILKMKDQSTIAMQENSMVVLQLLHGGTQFHLKHGQIAAALRSPHPPFVISTPHGRVEALGTEFTVNVE
jgi:hypothetical protein